MLLLSIRWLVLKMDYIGALDLTTQVLIWDYIGLRDVVAHIGTSGHYSPKIEIVSTY